MPTQRPRNMAKLRLSLAFLGIYWLGLGLLSPCYSQDATGAADTRRQGFEVSFIPGARDEAGNFMGGTEIRSLVGHAGKLFAGNGYWEDEPGSEGFQGAEILVLDGPDGRWRVDHAFDEWMPGGRARNLAIADMGEMSNSGVWLQRMRPAEVRDNHGEDLFLVGLEAFIPWDSRVAAGHQVFNIGRGRLEGNAWYLIRQSGRKI